MSWPVISVIFVLSILFLIIVYGLFWHHPRKLSQSKRTYYSGVLTNASKKEPHSALIACDTILEHIMKDLGNRGTMGEMLQKRSNYKNIEYFWKYHKLRNKVVHDIHPPKITIEDVETFKKKIEEQFLNG